MKEVDVLIVGGGPAGVVTALTVKKNNPKKRVLLIKKDERVLIPCGIPYLLGTLEKVEDNLMPEKTLKDNNIELIIDEVVSVDAEKKMVSTREGEGITYDKLVLATGSKPVKPPLKGIDLDGVFYIKKDFSYIRKLREGLENASDVVIVGGGYIGVEIADEIHKKGKRLTIVEMQAHLLQQGFDEEFYMQAEKKLREAGVNIRTDTRVEEILGTEEIESVKLSTLSNKTLKADMIIVCVGARPEITLAEKTGLTIGPKKGIVVDEYMRTSKPDILAVGDCTEDRDFFTREVSSVMLASTATSEARIAGENIFKLRVIKQNKGTIGIYSTKIGDLVLATAGLTESKAEEREFDYVVGEANTRDRHPGCMPNAHDIKVKLVFSRDSGVLLGAQASGGETVGEIINIMGLAIQKGMTIAEITTLQIGTHPLLTPAPTAYPLILAAEDALSKT